MAERPRTGDDVPRHAGWALGASERLDGVAQIGDGGDWPGTVW